MHTKFIQCQFHDTPERLKTKDAPIVNLSQVRYIAAYEDQTTIEFHFSEHDRIIWSFVNTETRDKEYVRIMREINLPG